MKFNPKHALCLALAVAAMSLSAMAQETGSADGTSPRAWRDMLSRADSLLRTYSFSDASLWYDRALQAAQDSTSKMTVEDSRVRGQNALSMMGYCSDPVVVARRRFSLDEFFLFYPLKDGSWRKVPNQLDSVGGNRFARAMYLPSDAKEIYYASHDETGASNIYRSALADTVWTAPALINEEVTSTSNEIFPMLSPDGKTLYFASEGLYGMGGYDLYSSKWNDETADWDVPVNMGFPYSSPYDDFLFVNTPDGKYSIFASNRDCPADSVCVYVLEYDGMPVRRAITDEDEIRSLSSLTPDGDLSRMDNGSAVAGPAPDNEETREYMLKMEQVRRLRDSLANHNKALEADRAGYSKAPEAEKEALMASIAQREAAVPAINAAIEQAVAELQQIEMDFLMKGVVIDPSKIKAEASREVVGASSGYAFTKNSFGPSFRLKMLKPQPVYDYTFRILPEGKFVEGPLPEGLVYQIQLFSSATKATLAQIKGLSPVFERAGSGGRKVYSAGVFRTYSSALSNLNKVKRLGFKGAYITAFSDGEAVTVAKARALEAKIRTDYYVKIYPPNGSSLSDLALSAIRQQTSKDLVKTSESGAVVFLAGPFSDHGAAEALEASVHAAGVTNTAIEARTVQP